ncbi:MAG: DUF1566 domain-containing protein [Desulfobulbaceae bacterium]|jgi:hypothetical protein|nr:DUF1566 domain-containing protein [Desulfobulbaceae bacterium]
MDEFHSIQVGDQHIGAIDWEMTPDLTFGTFESWGGRERVRNNNERLYYFFVDGWDETPKLCLMERGVKHAKVVAEIAAPVEMLARCVASGGKVARFEQSFAISDEICDWLVANILDKGASPLVRPVSPRIETENMGEPLPSRDSVVVADGVRLPATAAIIQEEELPTLIRAHVFFEAEHNPHGGFAKQLAAVDDDTVIDLRCGLMWQRGGLDIASHRVMNRRIEELNAAGFAGYHDWRLPTMEEALSLLEPTRNAKGLHLPLCFSKEQPFVFVAAQRKPGGYWFVDFKQGRAFWSSGTIPGGFARLTRGV